MRRQTSIQLSVFAMTLLFAACLAAEEKTNRETKRAAKAATQESNIAKQTIDIGVVVSDIEKSVEFYTKALGFRQAGGFKVAGKFAKDAGLTNGPALDIKVLKLGTDENATSLKLMQIKDAKSKKSDNSFIHSQLGVSYLTIFVKDTGKAVEQLKKHGIKTLAKTPVDIPKEIAPGMGLTLVRDPDGNIIELVGPKK